ncbi:hypothetical protein CRENBAI_014968 [Crenichthys baileyi]|uniref:Uncharacterized protein n=1 Tax=Crenichthys baileyi TaxID=28760 RepID=A0AAV9RJU2_9TELE
MDRGGAPSGGPSARWAHLIRTSGPLSLQTEPLPKQSLHKSSHGFTLPPRPLWNTTDPDVLPPGATLQVHQPILQTPVQLQQLRHHPPRAPGPLLSPLQPPLHFTHPRARPSHFLLNSRELFLGFLAEPSQLFQQNLQASHPVPPAPSHHSLAVPAREVPPPPSSNHAVAWALLSSSPPPQDITESDGLLKWQLKAEFGRRMGGVVMSYPG